MQKWILRWKHLYNMTEFDGAAFSIKGEEPPAVWSGRKHLLNETVNYLIALSLWSEAKQRKKWIEKKPNSCVDKIWCQHRFHLTPQFPSSKASSSSKIELGQGRLEIKIWAFAETAIEIQKCWTSGSIYWYTFIMHISTTSSPCSWKQYIGPTNERFNETPPDAHMNVKERFGTNYRIPLDAPRLIFRSNTPDNRAGTDLRRVGAQGARVGEWVASRSSRHWLRLFASSSTLRRPQISSMAAWFSPGSAQGPCSAAGWVLFCTQNDQGNKDWGNQGRW